MYEDLDKIHTLTWSVIIDEEDELDLEDKPEVCEHFRKYFTEEPPPGISPIKDVQVLDYNGPDEDGNLQLTIKMSLRDFIHSCVEYDTDPYEILTDIKRATDQATTQLAMQYLADETQGFNVAVLKGYEADLWPKKPAL